MSADVAQLLRWASLLLTLPVVGYAAQPFFSGAWRDLRAGRLGMDVPVALGIAIAFAASVWSTLAGTGRGLLRLDRDVRVPAPRGPISRARGTTSRRRGARPSRAAGAGIRRTAVGLSRVPVDRSGCRGVVASGRHGAREARRNDRRRRPGRARARRRGRGGPHRRERAADEGSGQPGPRRFGQPGRTARRPGRAGRERHGTRGHRPAGGTRDGRTAAARRARRPLRALVRARGARRGGGDRDRLVSARPVARALGGGFGPRGDLPLCAVARDPGCAHGRDRRARAPRVRRRPRPCDRDARARDRRRARQDGYVDPRGPARRRGRAPGERAARRLHRACPRARTGRRAPGQDGRSCVTPTAGTRRSAWPPACRTAPAREWRASSTAGATGSARWISAASLRARLRLPLARAALAAWPRWSATASGWRDSSSETRSSAMRKRSSGGSRRSASACTC